jgi:putative transposase
VAFIDAHRKTFGVAPICRVLSQHGCPIAPRTYYAHHTRPVSARSVRDEQVVAAIRTVHADSHHRYGARKVYHQLARDGGVDGEPVARCTVERLMRSTVHRATGSPSTPPSRANWW